MLFANGTKKAGVFKDNVLVELLLHSQMITKCENELRIPFPSEFKQKLLAYIEEKNPKEEQ